jgi:DNA polymerase III epsilon subunit-like protein
MDASLWFRDWAVHYDGFPDDYLVIDVESTGPCIEQDLVIQVGWCKVVNRKPVENSGIILNWDRSPLVDTNWLRKRIDSTAKYMEEQRGKTYPWSYDALQEGERPVAALSRFMDILTEARDTEQLVVAHNGVCFDLPVLTRHFRRYLKINYQFHPDEIWDTGAMEKASQIQELLCYGEQAGDFAYRLVLRSNDYGVRWNLHDHCVPKYCLDERFELDLQKSHTAPFDAFITHLLFEEYRTLADLGLERYPNGASVCELAIAALQ